jgi:hypothetical protein
MTGVADSLESLVFTIGGMEYHQQIVEVLRQFVDDSKAEEGKKASRDSVQTAFQDSIKRWFSIS